LGTREQTLHQELNLPKDSVVERRKVGWLN